MSRHLSVEGPDVPSRLESIALAAVVLAVVPYIALKLLWLSGSDLGVRGAGVATELHTTRVVVGNNVTIGLELLAVVLALALTSSWGRRLPAWIVLGLGAGATGLLAPVLLGLPFGSILQLAVRGDVRTGGMTHLSPWVFATVYGGFGLLAIAMAVLAWRYAVARWGRDLRRAPEPPRGWTVLCGGLGLVPFGTAMVWWGVLGSGAAGPQTMDAVVQRTTLAVTGVLALGGFSAPLLGRISRRRPRLTWLVTWVGCTTAMLQAPTHVLLADGGRPGTAVVALALLTVPGSAGYGVVVLRRRGPTP